MIRLTARAEPPVRVAVDALVPERLAGLPADEIARLALRVGARTERVGDWFSVAVDGDVRDGHVAFEGACRRFDRVGAAMGSGTITVAGDAGAYAGAAMRGGRIEIGGDAGFGAAQGMRGGALTIRGDAGDGLGGAAPGDRGGMRGGVVAVHGSTGAACGDRMRRGLIAIAGAVGAGAGARMIAGTIVAGGAVAPLAGMGMRRGSIVALGGLGRVPATFGDCGIHDLMTLRLLARVLRDLGLAALAERVGPVRRLMGDLASNGRGEILVSERT
ncbi:MAG TPA: formylmethanofuran dehydrogenase subunit C [Stellaceae bacterium]